MLDRLAQTAEDHDFEEHELLELLAQERQQIVQLLLEGRATGDPAAAREAIDDLREDTDKSASGIVQGINWKVYKIMRRENQRSN